MYMKYIHAGRTIIVKKSVEHPGVFMETIEKIGGNGQKQESWYTIENGEKVYMGAGGGMIEEDTIHPEVLETMGKLIVLENGDQQETKKEECKTKEEDDFDFDFEDDEVEFYDGDEIHMLEKKESTNVEKKAEVTLPETTIHPPAPPKASAEMEKVQSVGEFSQHLGLMGKIKQIRIPSTGSFERAGSNWGMINMEEKYDEEEEEEEGEWPIPGAAGEEVPEVWGGGEMRKRWDISQYKKKKSSSNVAKKGEFMSGYRKRKSRSGAAQGGGRISQQKAYSYENKGFYGSMF